MFMFRSRKNSLVKRAWKRRAWAGTDGRQDVPQQLKAAARQLLHRLKERQLELLVAALDAGGGDPGECVLVQNLELDVAGETPLRPHLLLLWLWRWPDLYHAHHALQDPPIRLLPCCGARYDCVYVCANPYHWGRVLNTESPPPPYRRFDNYLLRPEDAAPSEEVDCLVESQETGGTHQYGTYSTHGTGTKPWCNVAYWEGRERVGRLYPVQSPSLNIMGDTPHGDGLSLASLAAHTPSTPPEQVKRTREKIGLGLVLYREGQCVWVYNRMDIPLFVNSPTLDPPSLDGGLHRRPDFSVHKVPPGHLLNIFDYDKARRYQKLPRHPTWRNEGPIDQNSVRISFAKGWGQNYRRQTITECPCWLEIHLVPPR